MPLSLVAATKASTVSTVRSDALMESAFDAGRDRRINASSRPKFKGAWLHITTLGR
jgi:hypothetical protein